FLRHVAPPKLEVKLAENLQIDAKSQRQVRINSYAFCSLAANQRLRDVAGPKKKVTSQMEVTSKYMRSSDSVLCFVKERQRLIRTTERTVGQRCLASCQELRRTAEIRRDA